MKAPETTDQVDRGEGISLENSRNFQKLLLGRIKLMETPRKDFLCFNKIVSIMHRCLVRPCGHTKLRPSTFWQNKNPYFPSSRGGTPEIFEPISSQTFYPSLGGFLFNINRSTCKILSFFAALKQRLTFLLFCLCLFLYLAFVHLIYISDA